MFWLHCGLFVLVIAVPGFISSADSTSKRGNACLPAYLSADLPARLFACVCLPACLPILSVCLPISPYYRSPVLPICSLPSVSIHFHLCSSLLIVSRGPRDRTKWPSRYTLTVPRGNFPFKGNLLLRAKREWPAWLCSISDFSVS